jgi:hypothetical protein
MELCLSRSKHFEADGGFPIQASFFIFNSYIISFPILSLLYYFVLYLALSKRFLIIDKSGPLLYLDIIFS